MGRFYFLLFLFLYGNKIKAQLLQQDFNSSTTIDSYVSATPGNGQFNAITTSGAGTTVSINSAGGNNKLRFDRTAGAQAGAFSRTTDFSPATSTLMYQFNLSITGTSVATTSAAVFQVGAGFGTANSSEATANTYARFSINTTTIDGTFQIRDISNGTNSVNITGNSTILWVLNNSGSVKKYRAPDGTDEPIADDKADIWAGTARLFNDVNIQTATQVITDLKFVLNAGSPIVDIDDILIDPIPPITTTLPATAITPTTFIANWNTVPGVTGYRIDVATDPGFTNFLTGFNNLYISGQSTSSIVVTGLGTATSFFYRVRPASQYNAGEFEAANSDTRIVNTGQGSLPVLQLNLTGEKQGESNLLRWTTVTENNNKGFEVQSSLDGINYSSIGFVPSKGLNGSSNDILHYIFIDKQPAGSKQFYRLWQKDLDGGGSYSNTIMLNGSNAAIFTFKLIPNPSQYAITLFIDAVRPFPAIINVIGSSGKTEIQKEVDIGKGTNTVTLDIDRLAKGNYFVALINKDDWERMAVRFVKQ